MTIGIAKVCADGNNVLFSERLKATHPVVEALGQSMLTGCQVDRLSNKNLLKLI